MIASLDHIRGGFSYGFSHLAWMHGGRGECGFFITDTYMMDASCCTEVVQQKKEIVENSDLYERCSVVKETVEIPNSLIRNAYVNHWRCHECKGDPKSQK